MGDFQDFGETSLSVSQFTQLIKDILEGTFPSITVEGEISNWRPSSNGHLYFTLKDEKATISAVMFKYSAMHLTFVPQNGMKVKVTGSLSVYETRGNYQIKVLSMEQLGDGNILQIIEERKHRLADEGLFDEAKKKPLPFFPKTIGVVTSPTGAALRDVLQILGRRNEKVSVMVLPCVVQGTEAAETIAQKIKIANEYNLCDVLIIGRGGGSLEDLLPFSEECVVRAIAESKIPTISAVGHEIDWALSDYAADVRAPTPSAAAEIASPLLSELMERFSKYETEFYRNISNRIDTFKTCIKNFSGDNLELRFRNIETTYLQRFDEAKTSLIQTMQNIITQKKHELVLLKNSFEQLDPMAILNRGYSLVYDENGKLIKSTEGVELGEKINVMLAKGNLFANVTEKNDFF